MDQKIINFIIESVCFIAYCIGITVLLFFAGYIAAWFLIEPIRIFVVFALGCFIFYAWNDLFANKDII